MESTRRADDDRMSGASMQQLVSSGILVFTEIHPDRIPEKAGDTTLAMLKRAENIIGDPAFFGRFAADAVNILAGYIGNPKKTLLIIEDGADLKYVTVFAAMVYEETGFNRVLERYNGDAAGRALQVTDLRKEPLSLPEREAAYAVVVGPFRFYYNKSLDYATFEDKKAAIIVSAVDEFRSVLHIPVETPINTESS